MRIILLLLLSLRAYAAGHTCVSAVSGDWATAGTWTNCGGGSPGDGDIAKITNLHTVHISTHVTVGLSQTATTAAMLNSTTLSAAITSTGQTAITVASAANIVNGQYLMLLAEGANTMEIVTVSCSGACTTSLTIVRAQLGTAASLHANAAVVDVGSVPAISGTGSNYFGGNGTGILVIDDGGWLTYRGNVEQCSAVWTVGKDAIIEHDSSVQGGTAHYQWIIGNNLFPDSTKLQIRGTLGHRTLIRKATSSAYSGGFQKFVTVQGSGQYDWEYVTIDSCGGSATLCAEAYNHNPNALIARCDHCLVTNSGYIGAAGVGVAGQVCSITNSSLTSSADASARTIRVTFGGAGSVILDTIYTDGVLVLGGSVGDNATGTHVRNVLLRALTAHSPIDPGGASFRVAEFDRVLRITDQQSGGSTGAIAYIPGGNMTRLMCLMNSSTNPHCFSGPMGIAGLNDVVDGAYFEKIGTGDDGDAILGASGPATLTTIKNTVMACSTTDGFGMSLSSTALPTTKTFALLNNTYCGKEDSGNSRGFGFEVAGTAAVGMLAAARNNIVFCVTSTSCYLVHKGPTGTAQAGTYANVDYNWQWNVGTGPYFDTAGGTYAPDPPGSHDSSGDPQFVQQRHFLDWGQMLKPSISTWSDIVAEFAKMNDDVGYDSRFNILNAYDWLRDGYRPRNPAVMNAGDTGGRVGAMDAYGTRTVVVGPAKIVGPITVK